MSKVDVEKIEAKITKFKDCKIKNHFSRPCYDPQRGVFLVIGGNTESDEPAKEIYVYDPSLPNKIWEKHPAEMPEGRNYCWAQITFDRQMNKLLFCWGGYTTFENSVTIDQRQSFSLMVYNFSTKEWKTYPEKMRYLDTEEGGFYHDETNDYFYVYGKYGEDIGRSISPEKMIHVVHIFNITEEKWSHHYISIPDDLEVTASTTAGKYVYGMICKKMEYGSMENRAKSMTLQRFNVSSIRKRWKVMCPNLQVYFILENGNLLLKNRTLMLALREYVVFLNEFETRSYWKNESDYAETDQTCHITIFNPKNGYWKRFEVHIDKPISYTLCPAIVAKDKVFHVGGVRHDEFTATARPLFDLIEMDVSSFVRIYEENEDVQERLGYLKEYFLEDENCGKFVLNFSNENCVTVMRSIFF